jgi:hypothetical protein
MLKLHRDCKGGGEFRARRSPSTSSRHGLDGVPHFLRTADSD